jgi:excisionase family DNA binding protein
MRSQTGNLVAAAGPQPHKATYTVEEAAEILGVSRNSAYQAVRAGELPALKIGKRLLVPKAAFEQLLAGGEKADTTAGNGGA